jgi:hypothetical protein
VRWAVLARRAERRRAHIRLFGRGPLLTHTASRAHHHRHHDTAATRASLKVVTGCHVYAVAPSSGGALRTVRDPLGAAVADVAAQVRASAAAAQQRGC